MVLVTLYGYNTDTVNVKQLWYNERQHIYNLSLFKIHL